MDPWLPSHTPLKYNDAELKDPLRKVHTVEAEQNEKGLEEAKTKASLPRFWLGVVVNPSL